MLNLALGESNDSFGVVTRRQAREIIKKIIKTWDNLKTPNLKKMELSQKILIHQKSRILN